MILCTGQAGFEAMLSRELAERGLSPREQGPGWVWADGTVDKIRGGDLPSAVDPAFPHIALFDASEFSGTSVNALSQSLVNCFLQSLKGERVESAWPCLFDGPQSVPGLAKRIKSVERAFDEVLKKRLSRVSKLAQPYPLPGKRSQRGFFVWFSDFGRCHASREAFFYGPRRMADDDLAPSRSYLKVEESYAVLGREPVAGETVVDLGAAPGGWSYSAAKRGAKVLALDNGPLKGGALGHPNIEHRREDAFHYAPPEGTQHDWLFCDMVEEPHHVLRDVVEPWLSRRWCKHYVINLKFGRVDPLALLGELHALKSPFATYSATWKVAHLFHDREEFTVVGTLS